MSADRSTIRIVIADHHAMLREGLRHLLKEQRGMDIVDEGADSVRALGSAIQHRPDVLLLELELPGNGASHVLRNLQAAGLETRTVILAESVTKERVRQLLDAGVRGIVMKTASVNSLIKAIYCVVRGELWVDRATLSDLIRDGSQNHLAARTGLTTRELELVREIAAGASNKDIACKCAISEKTVKRHLANIFEKIGVSTRLELAVFAMNKGLVKSHDA